VYFQNLSIPGRKYHSFPDRQKKSSIRSIAKKNPNFAQNFLVEFLPARKGNGASICAFIAKPFQGRVGSEN
jgi:hypothetical protein